MRKKILYMFIIFSFVFLFNTGVTKAVILDGINVPDYKVYDGNVYDRLIIFRYYNNGDFKSYNCIYSRNSFSLTGDFEYTSLSLNFNRVTVTYNSNLEVVSDLYSAASSTSSYWLNYPNLYGATYQLIYTSHATTGVVFPVGFTSKYIVQADLTINTQFNTDKTSCLIRASYNKEYSKIQYCYTSER